MSDLEISLEAWKHSLGKNIDVGSLINRNKTAHKWKAPWRLLLLREAVAWRLQDLLEQSFRLHASSGLLGARILLRSGFETVALLIHSNQAMRQVVAGELDFHDFSDRTTKLLLGSRDKTTSIEAINIVTVIKKADTRYPGLYSWYAALSESTHPNYEGLLIGYSKSDQENHVTSFENRWSDLYSKGHLASLEACKTIFDNEYNNEWPHAFEALEEWIQANDTLLETTKRLRID